MKLIKIQLCCLLSVFLCNSLFAQGQISMTDAAINDDYLSIETSIQEGYDVFFVESSGFNLIDHAITSGKRNLLKVILINKPTLSSENIFHIFSKAIGSQQAEIIQDLLSMKIHRSMEDDDMERLIYLAMEYDNATAYQLLTLNSPNVNTRENYLNYLSVATTSNKVDVFHFIFKNKNIKVSEQFINKCNFFKENSKTREQLVHKAANSLPIMTFLIEEGADINALTSKGQTPLHLTQNPKIARLLIANGATINVKDNEGYTPLYYAKKTNHRAMIAVLESALKKK